MCRRAEVHERPWESVWSLPELRARFEHPDAGERTELFAAFDADTLVGGGYAAFPLDDNTDKADVHVMVAPEHRRRGAGTRLVEAMADRAAGDGRSLLTAESSYPFEERETHGYRRFAEANGFRLVNTEVVRLLQLPVGRGLLDRLVTGSAAHHGDYRIETITGAVPERYLPSYCHTHNQLAVDAPTGDIDFEEEAMTPQRFRQSEQRMKAAGQTRLSAVALTGDDQVVAYSDLVVKDDPGERVQQWGTLVDRAHRGHRLGTAVKAANLLTLQRMFPDRTEVVTSNAEVNRNMVDINDRLGFRPVAVLPMFLRTL